MLESLHAAIPALDFDSASPAYALIRWVWFAALTVFLGATTFRTVVLPRCDIHPRSRQAMVRIASRIATAALTVDLLAAPARLAAQSLAVFGSVSTDALVLLSTGWGRGILLQSASAIVALLALTLLSRRSTLAWTLTALAALPAAAAPAFSGHAAAADLQPWAVLADTAHVLAAGAWIGTLLVVAVNVARVVRDPDPEPAHAELATLVHAFSPAALAAAAILLLSGAFTSWIHLRSLDPLFRTAWGRVLLLKLAAVVATAAAGAWNWRRVRPALGTPPASARLHASTRTELLFGLLVLLLTAVVVALEPPFTG